MRDIHPRQVRSARVPCNELPDRNQVRKALGVKSDSANSATALDDKVLESAAAPSKVESVDDQPLQVLVDVEKSTLSPDHT